MSSQENQKLIENRQQLQQYRHTQNNQHIVGINKTDDEDDDSDMACRIGCLMGCLFNLLGILCIFRFNKKWPYLAGCWGAILWFWLMAVVFICIRYMGIV